MKRALGIAGLAAAALGAGLGAAWWWSGSQPRQLPDFALPDLAGETRHADEWRGKVLVLNFWATWCKPCREEVPMLIRAQADLGDDGLRIVGIAVDEPAPVRRFADEYGITYPVLVGAMGAMKLQDALRGGSGLPFTAVVDRRGRVRSTVSGAIDRERLESLVRPLLADD